MSHPTLVQSGRIQIAAESHGTGTPLVYAHGLTGDRSGTFVQLESILSHHTVIAYDQRGHGDSTPVDEPALYDPYEMAEDLGRVMDAYSVNQAIIGGESMGAATAMLFALAHPERVQALLLKVPAFGATPNPDRESIRTMGELIEQGGVAMYLEHARSVNRFNLPEDLRKSLSERLLRHDEKSLATACKTVIDWTVLSDMKQLADLTVPTCVVAWRDDPLHPFELAEEMVQVMPNAILHEQTILQHFSDPASTGRIYSEFLQSL